MQSITEPTTEEVVTMSRTERKLNRKLWYTWYHDILHMNALQAAIAAVRLQDMPHFDLRSTF